MKKMMKSLTEVMKRMRSNRMRISMMRKMTTNLRKRTIILKKMRTSKRMIIIYLLASQEIISLMPRRHQPQLRKTKAIREMKTRKRGQRSHDLVILEEILMRFKLCLWNILKRFRRSKVNIRKRSQNFSTLPEEMKCLKKMNYILTSKLMMQILNQILSAMLVKIMELWV